MKRIIEIAASFTGTIPTGSYENEKPFYSVKEILEFEEEDPSFSIPERQKELHQICYDQFKAQAERSNNERIAKLYKNIRFYDGEDGLQYPSVTSIIGMDKDFHIPEDELAQYAARGSIIHKQVEIYLQTKEWKIPTEIPEIASEYLTVKHGNLNLDLEDVDFRGFFEKYPFEVIDQEKTVINAPYRFGGRYDIKCIIKSDCRASWDKIEGILYDVPTILDIKTGATMDKTTGLMQQAAYAKTEDVQQIGLIHLTKENKCGYAKPTIDTNVERYWNLFINKREQFRKRFGV